MEKKELLDSLDVFTNQLLTTLNEIDKMKAVVRETIEENTALRLENEKLRERLTEEDTQNPVKATSAREGLNRIYLDGFHVCTTFYGQPRSEDCVFCDELLFRG
ncbi:DNA replication initiation control protein YabA [Streptococcus sp. NLN64]|uniref:DNA replication initiation control protein YabA n=1 Tax=Streptococcus sp. NLN64 TaxID=2822799 RepID=UPI0018CABEEB|nr:DNA replication initiation control protein YabA [Streptococcus sp. NLN64]MBG9367102.1 DNA replication initiation control protein YabA [Streptococcus sp. NLN64]